MNSGLEEKWTKDTPRFIRITNKDLVCIDCKHRKDDEKVFGNTNRCESYTTKPNVVLNGGACPFYEKEDN